MLSPKKPRILLLPEEQRMIDMLGMSAAEYRWYCREAQKVVRFKDGEPVAFDLTFFLVTLVVGIALNYAASLLAPTQRLQNDPARLEPRTVDGQDVVSSRRFTSRSSFTGLQNVVELGSPIPVVFAKREQFDGIWYGGVRVNTNLLWSQLWSVGGSQLFRGIFLVSEGTVVIDPLQTTMGDNLFGTYDLEPADISNDYGRVTFYYNRESGPIVGSTHYVAGRHYTSDIGNAASEVFMVLPPSLPDSPLNWQRKFVYTFKPQTQTQFGLFGPVGNNLGFKVNPVIRPAVSPFLQPEPVPADSDDAGDARVRVNIDVQEVAQRDKQGCLFSGRSGLVSWSGGSVGDGDTEELQVGDTVSYFLYSSSDKDKNFTVDQNSQPPQRDGSQSARDVAESVAARQNTWDDNIIEGELYKIGEALAVCTDRETARFVSEVESSGGANNVGATFTITRAGKARFTSAGNVETDADTSIRDKYDNGSQGCHLFRCAIASFVIDRPCKHIEIGFKSVVGIRYNGMMNWREAKTYGEADDDAGLRDWGLLIQNGESYSPIRHVSGTYTGVDTRYSFFKVGYRIASQTDVPYKFIRKTFCVRGNTFEPIYNYLAIEFDVEQRYEIEIVPVTAWQVRYDIGLDKLCLLDFRREIQRERDDQDGLWIRYNGDQTVAGQGGGFGGDGIPSQGPEWFGLGPTNCGDLTGSYFDSGRFGVPTDFPNRDSDGNYDGYVDAWGKISELFWHEEIQSSVGASPEHEVTYVNVVMENLRDYEDNELPPTYENMATLGMNLRSGTESNELGQLSVYVTNGQGNTVEGTHLFPECLEILLTNPRFGAGSVFPAALIDTESFAFCNGWTQKRRYFFDIGLSQPINLVNQANEWAQYFLLDLGKAGGKYTLSPVANFADDGAHGIDAMFTSGNIISMEVTSAEQQDRVQPIVVVKWRFEDQIIKNDLTGDNGKGIFPVIKTTSVREATTSEDAPVINVDISEFCTSEYHATDYAKMVCRKARLQDYGISMKTFPDVANVGPGSIIKVSSETIVYSQPNNGVILNDGRIEGFPGKLADDSYNVVLWDGQGQSVTETTLQVVNGYAVGRSNAVFTVPDTSLFTDTFKVQAVDYDEDGNVDIQAVVFPLDENGFSLLTKDWTLGWVLDGVNLTPPLPEPEPIFSAVSISGPSTGVRQTAYQFTATPFGPSTSTYTYAWSTTHGVINGGGSVVTLTVDENTTATISVDATEVESGITKSNSAQITIGEAPLIGIVVNGAVKPAINQSYVYSITIDGPTYSDYAYSWSTTIGTINGNTTDPTLLVDFAAGELGQTGVIRCELTQTFTGITKGFSLSVLVVQELALDIVGPTSVGINIPYGYFADLQGADPNTTTWFWEEI